MIGKPWKLREPPVIDFAVRMTVKLKDKIAKKVHRRQRHIWEGTVRISSRRALRCCRVAVALSDRRLTFIRTKARRERFCSRSAKRRRSSAYHRSGRISKIPENPPIFLSHVAGLCYLRRRIRSGQQTTGTKHPGETKRTSNRAMENRGVIHRLVVRQNCARHSSWGTSCPTPVGRADSSSDRTAHFVPGSRALALCACAPSPGNEVS
jgi:hypothetical protein